MSKKNDNFIEIRGLSFRYGDKVIFDGVDMDIPRGKVTAIMGPSGTGKTTLLRLLGWPACPRCRHCPGRCSTAVFPES